MTESFLSDLMAGKTVMDAVSLQELVSLGRRYPYFQALRLLYLKNLSELRSVRYADELKRNVVYLPDRARLFSYLDHGEYAWSRHLQQHKGPGHEMPPEERDAFQLIDNYLRHTNEEPYPEQLEDLLPQIHEEQPADYVTMLLDRPDIASQPDDLSAVNVQQSLIDSFIEKEEKEGVRLPFEELPADTGKSGNKEDVLIREDSFLTESLAKIYIKQKKYSKALEIIKKLSLKYPEKNVYFADQIRFLEKIITNIKTE